MADKVHIVSEQGEIFGRNQAIVFLKRALRRSGIRIDLAEVFSSGRSYELLSIYFEFSFEEGSCKHLFRPKEDYLSRIRNEELLSGFPLLLPKPPATILIDVRESYSSGAVPSVGAAFAQLAAY